MSVKIWKIVLFTEKEIATEEKISKKHCKMYNTEGKQSCEKCKREWWGRIRAPKEQREVRERERRRINKGGVLERVGGKEEKKREEREKNIRIHKEGERNRLTVKWKRDRRVGGRQGKTGEEREDVEMKERGGGEAVGEREWVKCQTDK